MWMEGYTGSLTDEQKIEKVEAWDKKTEHIAKRLDSNAILKRHVMNFELIKPLLVKYISKFIEEKDITNWVMLDIEEYEKYLIKSSMNKMDEDAKEMFEVSINTLVSTMMRIVSYKDYEYKDDDERREMIKCVKQFVEVLKLNLLEKHWLKEKKKLLENNIHK